MRRPSSPGVGALARETAVGLADLVGLHVQIARLELAAELQAAARQARRVGVLVALAVLGYALAVVGLALVIGGATATGISLVIMGSAHLGIGGIGVLIVRRPRRPALLPVSSSALSQSLESVAAATGLAVVRRRGVDGA